MRLDKKDLILKGNMYRAITVLSLPIMLNNFIQTLYNLADAMWVGRLGETEFAATSFVWPVIFLFISLGIGVSIAGTSILSQLIGANEFEKASKYASNLIVLSLVASSIFAILGYFISPIAVNLMGATGDFADFSNIYLKISFIGFPFVFVFFSFNSIMNSQGNTMIPTIISAISAVMNVILDPIFIFTLDMGVAGAAWATVTSQAAMIFIGVYALRKHSPMIKPSFRGFRFDINILRKIFNIGLPSTLGQTGSSFGFIILNSFIASYGTETLAAFAMVNRITSLIMQPPMGIGAALTSIVGQNMGANQMDRVHEAFNKAVKLVLSLSIVGAILLFIFDDFIINVFIKAEEGSNVISLGLTYLKFTLVIIPMMGLFSILQGLFQGSGHTKYSMAMDIVRLWGLRIPAILFFREFTSIGPTGIWISMSFSNVGIIIFGYIIYKSNRWKKKVIDTTESIVLES